MTGVQTCALPISSAGDILVYLPSDLAVTVKASIEYANGHNVKSEFAGLSITNEGGQFGPKMIFAEGSFNGGGPVLKLHTTNGNIILKKTKR